MFDRKEIDPEPKAFVKQGSAGRARNRHVKTGPFNTTPHFFTYYPHTSIFSLPRSYFPCPSLPNPIVAAGFYAARQPGQLSQGADAAATVRRAACRCGYGPAQRLSRSRPPPASRIRGRFASHEALPSRSSQSPIGESLADYEPLVLWKGINSVKQALHQPPPPPACRLPSGSANVYREECHARCCFRDGAFVWDRTSGGA